MNLAVFFYTIFIGAFRAAVSISSIWNPKAKKWSAGRKNIFERIKGALNDDQSPVIWVHCSSVGEFEQGRPVIEKLKSEIPNSQFLVTFFSPSGYEANKNYKGADHVFYLPMDSRKNAKKFLDIVNPSFVLWIKYEYWYHYLREIRSRNINCLLISAVFRKDQSFFKWWGGLHRKMLSFFTHLFVQNEGSKMLLKTIGIENCSISGDTRFDSVIEIAERIEPIFSIEHFIGDSKCIVAGSTWKEDEEALKKTFDAINNRNLKLIIAPHEIDARRIEELEKLFPASKKFSQLTGNNDPVTSNVLIIDNIGMLS